MSRLRSLAEVFLGDIGRLATDMKLVSNQCDEGVKGDYAQFSKYLNKEQVCFV
jgi:hypothetical protein